MGAAIGNCEKRPQNTKGKMPPVLRVLNTIRLLFFIKNEEGKIPFVLRTPHIFRPLFSAKTRLKSVSLRFFASPVKFPIIILLKYTKDY